MYYVSFFVYEPDFLTAKLAGLLGRNLDAAVFRGEQEETPLTSSALIAVGDWDYPDAWLIHSKEVITRPSSADPIISAYETKTLSQINDWFEELSSRYLWTVMPWAIPGPSCRMFAFVSRQRKFYEQWIDTPKG